jgi:protein-L-isoaspartate(D-aspartate) O-methyltransferase
MTDNFEHIRNEMVNAQLIPRGITDKGVLERMRAVPRHLFVPDQDRDGSYDDRALPIGNGQTISQPYMVAIMTQELKLKGKENVLEIGTGSGYQAAVLSGLSKAVYTVERIAPLAAKAKAVLISLGCANVEVVNGDGSRGLPEKAPFDRIIVTAAADEIPRALIDQLSDGGIIVAPVGESAGQVLTILKKQKGKISIERTIGCVFVPLIEDKPR